MYLSYFGIRVRDVARSVKLYTEVFGMAVANPKDVGPWNPREAHTVLLRDPRSGQRIELNYYPEGNPYSVPYAPGEELDHVAFRVDDLSKTLRVLETWSIKPESMRHYSGPIWETQGYRVAYVRDPDGVQLELFESTGKEPVPFTVDQY